MSGGWKSGGFLFFIPVTRHLLPVIRPNLRLRSRDRFQRNTAAMTVMSRRADTTPITTMWVLQARAVSGMVKVSRRPGWPGSGGRVVLWKMDRVRRAPVSEPRMRQEHRHSNEDTGTYGK